MQRFLKRHFGRFIPPALRAVLKQRFENVLEENLPATRKLTLHDTPSGIRCVIDDQWSFVAPEACRADLDYFTATPRGQTEFCVLADIAQEGGTFFDIGAHAGIISALFCAGNPANRVFSFEPSPILHPRLEEIAALNDFADRMHIEKVGIGEASGTMEMLIDPVGGFVQTQQFDHTMWADPKAIQIPIESIGDAAARLGVVPAVVKLDIEGYEFEAVRGAAGFFKRHRPKIFLELHLNYLEQRKLSAVPILETLGQCGYSFYSYSGHQLTSRQIHESPLANIHVIARAD